MDNKTVFDSNIWITYFLKGRFRELVELVFDYDVEFFRCIELTRELVEVLSRPKFKKYLELPLREYISFYEDLSKITQITPVFKGCRDPKDNYLFDLAYQSKSRFLVSGDKDIRETEVTKPLEILSLTSFKKYVFSLK